MTMARNAIRRAARRAAITLAAACALAGSCSDALLDEQDSIIRDANAPTVSPADASIITAHETITLRFPEAKEPSTVGLSGTLASSVSGTLASSVSGDWSTDGTTLTLNGAGLVAWAAGDGRTLSVSVTDSGSTATYDFAFDVFDGVCVEGGDAQASDDESKPWAGTQGHPFLTIPAALAFAAAKYPGGCDIRVAPMTLSPFEYRTDYRSDAASRILVTEGYSLLGGYSTDWTGRDVAANVTILRDESASGGSVADPNRAIGVTDSAVTQATVISGFTVYGGSGTLAAALYCTGASPTLSDMVLNAGSSGTGAVTRAALFIAGAGDPLVRACSMNESGGNADIYNCYGVYIYTTATGEPEFEGNTIRGGEATVVNSSGWSCAFYSETSSGTPSLTGNTIIGGDAYATRCLDLRSSPGAIPVYNNLVLAGSSDTAGTNQSIYVSGCAPLIRNNTISIGNASGYCATAYGVYLNGTTTATVIDNNIFVFVDGTSTYDKYGIYESGSYSDAAKVRNNCFHNFLTESTHMLYRNNTTTATWTTVATMESGLNAELADSASGNTDADPVLGSDRRLTASSPASVSSGGLDGAAELWDFTDDRDGTERTGDGTTGWSMGCFERD